MRASNRKWRPAVRKNRRCPKSVVRRYRNVAQVIEPENALPEVTLQELPESLQAACGRAGWAKLLPVQHGRSPTCWRGGM